jgi:putative addiction module component (TIGR02574 family)
MPADFDSVSNSAMSLPPDQRVVLANLLWDSVDLPEGEDAELMAEIDRRCAELDSGAVEAIPYEQVMREIREALNESRNPPASKT